MFCRTRYLSNHYCHRPYNNFIVQCGIPNFRHHGNNGPSEANFNETPLDSATTISDILAIRSRIDPSRRSQK